MKVYISGMRGALVNIAKIAGQSWSEDGQVIYDPQYVARTIIKQYDPELWRLIESNEVGVDRDGRVFVKVLKGALNNG